MAVLIGPLLVNAEVLTGLPGFLGGAALAAAAAEASLSLKKRVREAEADPKLGWTFTWGRSQADSCF